MNGQNRKDVLPGMAVDIVLKSDQKNGKAYQGHRERYSHEIWHPSPRYQS